MAAGDLLDADWQFEINVTLYGRGSSSSVLIDDPGVGGLGNPDAKTQDVDLPGRDGAFANPDYQGVRVITIPVMIVVPGNPATATTAMLNLAADWLPSTTDIVLAIQLPGMKFTVTGRPRSMKVDEESMSSGLIRALLRFDCPNPAITILT